MAFWKDMLLVHILALQVISVQARGESVDNTTKPRLHCYQCKSEISWDDCDTRRIRAPCPNEKDHVCLTLTAYRWEEKNGTRTDRVLPLYAKYCSPEELCCDKQCKEIGWRCQVKCCSQDMCNGNARSAIWLNKIFFVVVQGLAIHNFLNTS